MAEDRFANVFSSSITLSAANTLTFAEMNFGIQLRDKLAIAIDQVFIFISAGNLALMTATGDSITVGLTNSDAVTTLEDYGDRRNIFTKQLTRTDGGTAGNFQLTEQPMMLEFSPPMIVLPTRMFMGADSAGLASAIGVEMRIHHRTVPLTTEQQLNEVLESFQLST